MSFICAGSFVLVSVLRNVTQSEYCDFILVQLVSANTRQHNILNLVLANIPDIISSVSVCDNIPGTDHDAVNFVIGAEICSKAIPSRYLYNCSKIDQDHY